MNDNWNYSRNLLFVTDNLISHSAKQGLTLARFRYSATFVVGATPPPCRLEAEGRRASLKKKRIALDEYYTVVVLFFTLGQCLT